MVGCMRTLRHEFKWRNLGFGGWRMPVLLYFTYRIGIMVYVLYWLDYSSLFSNRKKGGGGWEDGKNSWGDYLTNWTYTLLSIYVTWHVIASIIFHTTAWLFPRPSSAGLLCWGRPSVEFHKGMFVELDNIGGEGSDRYEQMPTDEDEENQGTEGGGGTADVEESLTFAGGHRASDHDLPRPSWYLCLLWLLYSAISGSATFVTVVYFTILYPSSGLYPKLDLENMQVHLLNSCVILLEHLISAIPYRLLHVVYPLLYCLIYMVFSLVLWAKDHQHYMYKILNWNNPGLTIGFILISAFIVIPLLHCLLFLVYKAKVAIYRRL
nr:hypothetical protein BaRGS_020993 [Batillaria attramentaria]